VRCGTPRRLVAFVAAEGGAVCAECRREPGEGTPLDAATGRLLLELGAQPLQRVATPAAATASRARRLLEAHFDWHGEGAGARARERSDPRPRRRSPTRG
jgi:recombinational DNA repair protein (RecF pathway)